MTDTAEALRQWIAIALKTEREKAGLSLSELARRAGLSKSTLSQLEAGSGNPGIETLWMLAVALNIPFSRLVDRPERTTRLVRAGEGPATFSEEAAVRATLLSTGSTGTRRDIYRMDLEPGRPRRSPAHIAGTTEHVLAASGRARVGPEAETEELSPGDYFTYPGDTAHLYEALEPGTVLLLVMEHA